ncbi:hypothetical protein BDR03DRAFT_961950 [Suillus americanus]|nr:hypothetical protein BDR03DRAFT_961950 [Suillus americanus]
MIRFFCVIEDKYTITTDYRALHKSNVVKSRCIKGMFALQGSAHSIRMRTLG